MTKVCLTIFARNEEANIEHVLNDLLRQTALDPATGKLDAHLFVVCNACSDGTAETARKVLPGRERGRQLTWEVLDLSDPGKTPAWNHAMREVLPADADYVIPMDADIRIDQDDLIMRCIRTLEANPAAIVATPHSRKDFRSVSVFNPLRHLITAFAHTQNGVPGICGQFYCARADLLRRIHIPAALHTQDGYLRAVILTNGLTEEEAPGRIIRVPGAYHFHPPHISLGGNFRYQKRQMIGTTLARLAYREMEKMPRDLSSRMQAVAKLNHTNPDWLLEALDRSPKDLRRVPRSYRMRKIKPLATDWRRVALMLPLALPAFLYDQVVATAANAELERIRSGSTRRLHDVFSVRQ